MTKIKILLRIVFRLIFSLCFRVEVSGMRHYQAASHHRLLVVANHVSLLDGALLAVYLPQVPVFVVNTQIAHLWWVKPFLAMVKHVKIDPSNAFYIKSLVKIMEKENAIVIFPEGRISVTGTLMKIYPGPGFIAAKTKVQVLPIYLDGPVYSKFSYLKGVIRQSWFPKIYIKILPAFMIDTDQNITNRQKRHQAGQVLEKAMQAMVFCAGRYRKTVWEAFLEAHTCYGANLKIIQDRDTRPFNYRQLARIAFALAEGLSTTNHHRHTGILLPNAVATVATFFGVHLLGSVPVMLNYTAGVAGIGSALKTADIKVVISSKKFIQAGNLQLLVEVINQHAKLIYLEDIRDQITILGKLKAWLSSWFPQTAFKLSAATHDPYDAAVVLFTSGSEGEPKGVVLSHVNLLANRQQVSAVISFNPRDIMLNAMPLFHSFGLMAGMILPILSGVRVFLYPSPLHYSVIPDLAYNIRATIIFGTNTFLAGYANKADSYDFHEIRLVLAGAERLQDDTRQQWVEKFGLRILEGYGATEASPVLAINTPMHCRAGTVGRFLPGIDYRLVPVPGIAAGGRLHVSGDNIMRGYLISDRPGILQPLKTEQGAGWYDTGDIVTLDQQGYITIEGRAKRFAKIAGEMISLMAAEQIAKNCWPNDQHAVIALPDPKKGERLVLYTTVADPERHLLAKQAAREGRSELLVAKVIHPLENIPLTGTGKVDYMALLNRRDV